MQDPASVSTDKSPSSPAGLNAGLTSGTPSSVEENPSAAPPESSGEAVSNKFDQPLTSLKETLGEHKGKLAIGAAATLGMMVYYKWREKQLAEEEPQEYERLQRIKDRVRRADDDRGTLDEPRPI
jgi:uncharacterized protein HemX